MLMWLFSRRYEEQMPSILMNQGQGSIIIAENLTDLSSPAAFADKAMKGLSAKQVRGCLAASRRPQRPASSPMHSSVCCTMPPVSAVQLRP
jgi:hypothetical protein